MADFGGCLRLLAPSAKPNLNPVPGPGTQRPRRVGFRGGGDPLGLGLGEKYFSILWYTKDPLIRVELRGRTTAREQLCGCSLPHCWASTSTPVLLPRAERICLEEQEQAQGKFLSLCKAEFQEPCWLVSWVPPYLLPASSLLWGSWAVQGLAGNRQAFPHLPLPKTVGGAGFLLVPGT